MIRSGTTLPDRGTTQCEVAIVGAGAIGIALAIRLAGRVGRVVLIEAGGESFDPSTAFSKAERVEDARHAPTELYRRRMLGGTTSVWGGRCIPFDPEDFTATRDRPGWPIRFDEFDSYVGAALDFLDAGPAKFSASSLHPGQELPLPNSRDLELGRIERYSKPTNAWRKWGAYLSRTLDVTVIHDVTCTSVLTNASGTAAAGVEVRSPSGTCHTIAAGTVILACGGLETPRLLLASRRTRHCGLGNEQDLVGRYYMTHLVSSAENLGMLYLATPDKGRAFDFRKTVDGVYARRMILLTPEARERENLPNIVFRPGRPPIDHASHKDSVLSTMYLVRHLLIPPEYARSLTANGSRSRALQGLTGHGRNVVGDLPALGRFGMNWLTRRILATRKLPSVFLYRKDGRYPLEFNAEQMPNFESRVKLGSDTDPAGMPRLVVQWKFFESEIDAICRAYRVLAASVAASGLGHVELEPDLKDSVRRVLVAQGGHHIGTARMGLDASVSVVNSDCEVWATRGLFVAGTSVLPTSGFANPTLTAVAIAFRLADHLLRQQQSYTATGGYRSPKIRA